MDPQNVVIFLYSLYIFVWLQHGQFAFGPSNSVTKKVCLNVRKRTFGHVRPVKIQGSLSICLFYTKYSRTSLSRTRLFRITAYPEVKI